MNRNVTQARAETPAPADPAGCDPQGGNWVENCGARDWWRGKVTLLMVVAALVVAAFPAWSGGLIYDRQAILRGECWRLFTGHWVHFSRSHLVYDTLALALAGGMLEARRTPGFGCLCLLAPWIINLMLLACVPDLRQCGGLSGLATCALVYLAVEGLGEASGWRWACWLTLAAVAGKIFWEMETGHLRQVLPFTFQRVHTHWL